MSSPAVAGQICDLVMKGGITSGVIYPKLASELASRYRLKNIGGTSAGAIAAGASAAAEYGRTHGNPNAFDKLAELPTHLAEPTMPTGRSRLFTLFQPTGDLRQHFGVLAGALNAKPADAVRRITFGLLKMHLLLVVAGLLVGGLLLWQVVESLGPTLHGPGAFGVAMLGVLLVVLMLFGFAFFVGRSTVACIGFVAGALILLGMLLQATSDSGWTLRLLATTAAMQITAVLALMLTAGLVVFRFLASMLRGMHTSGYGFCSGRTAESHPGGELPGLTDWLTGYLDELAGPRAGHRPLTFGDLWGTGDPDAPRQINLEVMTSAVSQQTAYGIPFRKGTAPFHYDFDEWSALFPTEVMTWLEQAVAATPDGDRVKPLPPGARVTNAAGRPLRILPRQADLPVVVAIRMSLSFPILLSAVPLYAIDWSRKENQDTKARLVAAARNGAPTTADLTATRIWFSDGGIGSNMPLHMFDALLPGHPTFAVNLKAEHPDFKIEEPERPENDGGRIYLPETNQAGELRYWPEPPDTHPFGGLIGFLKAIINTMQNWHDEIMFPYPGFRDRIVQISQRPTEGGLNLDMPRPSVDALANAGEMAADRLINRFHPHGEEQGRGWTNHQEVRLGTFLGTMQPTSAALQPSLASGTWAARVADIKGYEDRDRQLAFDFLKGVEALGDLGASKDWSLEDGALKPLAEIRIVPKV
jgi:predicted acylesterase/phospholipase RssA